jgi:hypothetical protein
VYFTSQHAIESNYLRIELKMDIIWNGTTHINSIYQNTVQVRNELADAAKSYDWPNVLQILSKHKELVNTSRLGGKSLFTPLHQVAHAGAPVEIAQQIIHMGAFRTLQNARGERPVDVAERKQHHHLRELLTPVLKHQVPIGILLKIQCYFHEVIRGRIDQNLPNHQLRLPELEPLLELDQPAMWFPVPGMYGGFSYHLSATGVDAILIAESWSRVVDGSGQRHQITSRGSRLIGEGFV